MGSRNDMPPEGRRPARSPEGDGPAHSRGRGRRAGAWASSRRQRGGSRAFRLSIDQLETRALLSTTPIMGPPPSTSLPPQPPAQETFNLQLQPGSAGSVAALLPLIAAEGATVQPTTISGLYTVQVPGADASRLAAALSASPAVAYASESLTMQDLTEPNDPDYTNGDEWQLNGTWGINAPGAWSVTTGSDSVIVADVDTGLNYDLSDMIDNVWLNQAEIPSSVLPKLTDVDDDGVISFADLNNAVNQGPGKITATIGGVVNGSAVLAPTSLGRLGQWLDAGRRHADPGRPDRLEFRRPTPTTRRTTTATARSPLRRSARSATTRSPAPASTGTRRSCRSQFLDGSGNGTDTAAAEAIDYAVDHGAKVINASWGSTGSDPTIADAIAVRRSARRDHRRGRRQQRLQTTTRRCSSPPRIRPQYPNVISVAATDQHRRPGELLQLRRGHRPARRARERASTASNRTAATAR